MSAGSGVRGLAPGQRLLSAAFALLVLSGAVATIGWFIELPVVLVRAAALVAVVALSVFFFAGWRQSRRSGQTVVRSLRDAVVITVRLVVDVL